MNTPAGKPRRVVFIMTDTQRTDMLGCYGNPAMKTPHLDALAKKGIRFDRAYTCQPVCGPARSALFTGMWPHTNGSWGNSMPLGDNVKTIGQRLHDHAIHTAYIGKWHLDGADYFGTGRSPDGWDEKYWYDMRRYLDELSETDRVRSRQPDTNRDPNLTADFTYGHRCSNRAIDFLENHGAEDFFLVISYDEPHHPYLCPRPYSEMYKGFEFPKSPNVWDDLKDKPEHHRVWAGKSLQQNKDELKINYFADFFGCNSFVDSEIGRVIEAIDRHAPDALVIYTSDHGDMICSHSIHGKGAAMYDEITHIPLIVRWPGASPENTASPHPVSHIDLAPTIMDAFGLPVSKAFEGASMLPTFRDPGTRTNDAVFIEFARYESAHDTFGGFQPIRAAFDGRHKLVINLMTSDELYDLQTDPQEMKNLIESPEYAQTRNALHDRILDWMNRTRDPFRGYFWQRRPWRADAPPARWNGDGLVANRPRENPEYEPEQLLYETGMTRGWRASQEKKG